MVSNSLNIELRQLLDTLAGISRDLSDDPEYQELREALPQEWPL